MTLPSLRAQADAVGRACERLTDELGGMKLDAEQVALFADQLSALTAAHITLRWMAEHYAALRSIAETEVAIKADPKVAMLLKRWPGARIERVGRIEEEGE